MRPTSAALMCLALSACRERVPTYERDVAPIFEQHCRDCHRPGGVAPVPSLADYASAVMYAQPIKLAVQTRRMPPWAADNTGLCGSWEGARWLTRDEIATIAKWQESGVPRGDPQKTSAPTRKEEAPFRADATLDLGGVYQPGLGGGGNRCFVADPKLDRDRLLSAIRVVSGDARAVAQVTLFALDSPAADAEAAALDAADAGLGYSCYGGSRVHDARMIASWTAPDPVLRLPRGSGVRVRAGRKIVVQIHYDIAMTGGAFATDTRVELEADDHAREAWLLPIAAGGSLAPGKKYVAVDGAQTIERPLRVLGVAARMHIRGDTLHLTVEHGAQSTCLATFDHWHFNDQQLFRARRPVALERGDRVHVSCAYNTQGRVRPVLFGDDIDDEECVGYLLVTD